MKPSTSGRRSERGKNEHEGYDAECYDFRLSTWAGWRGYSQSDSWILGGFWQAVWALVIWPYYIGVAAARLVW